MAPVARYAKSGDGHIAYTVQGDGPIDLVWISPWVSQVEYLWSQPALERVTRRLTRFARLITFDRRGSGLSDPLFGAPTLEDQMDDVLAVMDAAGANALILYATFARATWAPDFDWAWTAEERARHMDETVAHWGEGHVAASVAPSQLADPAFMEWAGRLERLAASPATIRRIFELIGEMDVRDVLPSIRVPTLVMHRSDDSMDQGRALALHRRQDSGRALRGARGRREHVRRRRLGVAARRDRGVPHGHTARARAGPHARHGAVH